MKVFKLTFLALILCAIQGCMLAPKYERPFVEMPETWRISADESSTYANLNWWRQFQDPVLDCLIDEALANNRDLKVAAQRVLEFKGNLAIVESNLYPQLSGALSALKQESSLYVAPVSPVAGFPRVYDVFSSILNASYELDIWGEIRSASDSALAQLYASVEARRTVVLTLVAAVASSYIQLRQYDMQQEISQMTLESRQESYRIALARYLGGLTSELEAKQMEAQMETAAAELLQYKYAVAVEENLLSVLVGHAPAAIQRGSTIDQLVRPVSVPAGIPCEILEQRPDVKEAEDLLIAANLQIGVARAQFLPAISLTADYGNISLQLKRLLTSPATTWQYAANVLQPVYTGGRLTGQLEVAKALAGEAFYAYQQVVLDALKEVENSLVSHQLAVQLVEIETKRVDALTTALNLAQLQYDNGQVDYLTVLDVQRTLFASQLSQAQAKGYVFLSLVAIYKSLAGGWVIDADAQALANF